MKHTLRQLAQAQHARAGWGAVPVEVRAVLRYCLGLCGPPASQRYEWSSAPWPEDVYRAWTESEGGVDARGTVRL